MFTLERNTATTGEEVNAWDLGVQLHAMLLGRVPFNATSEDTIGRSLRGNSYADLQTTLQKDYRLHIDK